MICLLLYDLFWPQPILKRKKLRVMKWVKMKMLVQHFQAIVWKSLH